ncbi:MAG TPA: serine/threonine-protein kinase [Steroidobacteraceae bacterium]|nr:serine/threonine-protein kinase [Steroidobacteraceae bacterium]
MPGLSPERWQRVQDVFHQAHALRDLARERYLNEACQNDPGLRSSIDSLLAADAAPNAILDRPFGQDFPRAALGEDEDRWIGRRVGAYEIVACIGHGGMGSVYRARRADSQYEKEVAIKLVRAGFGTELLLRRLRSERQILAGLDHPNIARLLDGGVTESGEPFLVLELVDGRPIDEYCEARQLPLTDRLRLFREVCAAVSHAHRHLVVHRDLKPANILVTDEGAIKLLDFGIAKLLQGMPLEGAELEPTRTLHRALTPAFSSPEQILGLPLTTSTDVYSLGVVLFHLIVGCSPYRGPLMSTSDALREVCEGEVERPSIAALRRPGSPQNRRVPHDELDDITLRALRKEPAKRYSSADDLSEDVRRYLSGLPVMARGDRWSYRAQKFWRRHRLSLTAAAIVALALVTGLIATLHEARVAERQHALAAENLASVRTLANTLIFQVNDSIKNLPGATAARNQLLGTALQYLDALASRAGSDRGLLRELADSYARLGDIQGEPAGPNTGDPKAALVSYGKALDLYRQIAPQGSSDASVLSEVVATHVKRSHILLMAQGNPSGAEREAGQAAQLASRIVALKPGDATAQLRLAQAYEALSYYRWFGGHMESAVEAAERAITIVAKLQAEQPADWNTKSQLVRAYLSRNTLIPFGPPTPAEFAYHLGLLHKALALVQELYAVPGHENDPRRWRAFSVARNNWGIWESMKGDNATAVELLRRAAAEMQQADPDPNNAQELLDLGRVRSNLGRALLSAGQSDAAREAQLQAAASLQAARQRTDTYEIEYLLGQTDEELGSIEAKKAARTASTDERLKRWRDARALFASAIARFEPEVRVVRFAAWDRVPIDRATAGLAASTSEIRKLESRSP